MSEYKVHRVRFIDHKHKALNSACFDTEPRSSKLAVSLEDGSIELRDAKKNFMVDFVIPGQEGRTVEHVSWNKGRLFSGGLNGQIIEWDLKKLTPKYFEDSCGGPVWCLKFNNKGDVLAAGCEDGSVRIFKVMTHGLNYERCLYKQESRILSLAWSKDDSKLVTGGFESTIRVYDFQSGRIISRITSDDDIGKQGITKVWAIEVLSNFTLVTGDSNGNTRFWDGNTGTLLSSFKSHEADVLTLAVNKDEVYSSGIDSKIVQFSLKSVLGNKTWTMMKNIRSTKHDVRALVIYRNPDTNQTYVVAGGIYPALFVTPTNSFKVNKVKSYFRHPPADVCQTSKVGNQILYRSNKKLNLWQLENTDPMDFKKCEQLFELHNDSDDHLCSSGLSNCGKYICYSTVQKARFYELRVSPLKLQRMYQSLPALTKIAFTPDSHFMVGATFSKSMHIIDLCNENEFEMNFTKLEISLPFRLMHVSFDSKMLCVVDAASKIWFFEITEQGLLFHSQAPSISDGITSVAFHPDNTRLFVSSSAKELFEYDFNIQKLLPWAMNLTQSRILECVGSDQHILNQIAFNPKAPGELFLQTLNEFGKLSINADIEKISRKEDADEDEPVSKKAKLSAFVEPPLKTSRAYKKIIHFSFNSKGELVVVEVSKSVGDDLAPSLKIKRFQN